MTCSASKPMPQLGTLLPGPACHSPIHTDYLMLTLRHQPDPRFSAFIHQGLLTEGFRIGFNRQSTQLVSARRNHPSALVQPEVVSARIATELEAGRLVGHVAQHLCPFVHSNTMELVPKSHQPNKWRLVVDLSFP